MNNNKFLMLAENTEAAYMTIAQLRHDLLEKGLYNEWKQLLDTSSLLNSNQTLLADDLISLDVDEQQ